MPGLKDELGLYKRAIQNLYLLLISQLPSWPGFELRYRYWKKRLRHLGEGARIDVGVHFQGPGHISIGDGSYIDKGVIILAGPDPSSRPRRVIDNPFYARERGEVWIGKHVHLAPYSIISGIGGVEISDYCGIAAGSKIYSFSHHYRSDEFPSSREFLFAAGVDPDRQYMIEGPVFLDTNVGLGTNVVIMPGASIARDSFVCVGGIVNSSFEDNSLIAGCPARRIGQRFQD